MLNDERLESVIEGLNQIVLLNDPIGEVSDLKTRPSGIKIGKMMVPLGVIGIIYESRPNVTIDAAALCIKSGNAVILRGGSEAINSNMAFYSCIKKGLEKPGSIQTPLNLLRLLIAKQLQSLLKLVTMLTLLFQEAERDL